MDDDPVKPGHGLPFSTICAMLEDAGYRRHEIRHLTRWYVRRVLQHDRDKDGRLKKPAEQEVKVIPIEDQIRSVLRKRGYPEHLLEYRIREIVAEQERKREIRNRRGRGGK